MMGALLCSLSQFWLGVRECMRIEAEPGIDTIAMDEHRSRELRNIPIVWRS